MYLMLHGAGPLALATATVLCQSCTMSHRPVYLQLRDQIAAGIIAGKWPEGAILPSVRAFAAECGANPLTVAKAYQQFQDDGLVEARRGIGMYVAAGAVSRLIEEGRRRFFSEDWPAIRDKMNRLGINPRELLAEADS